jgi:hypothetical protein
VTSRAWSPFSNLGPLSAAELQQSDMSLGANSISVDYWIDSSELLRQMLFGYTLPHPPDVSTTTVPGEISASITYPVTMSERLAELAASRRRGPHRPSAVLPVRRVAVR